MPFLAILDVGPMEMLVVFAIILMLFGGKKLPEMARGMGKALREFKKMTGGVEEEIRKAMDDVADVAKDEPRRILPPPSAEGDAGRGTGDEEATGASDGNKGA